MRLAHQIRSDEEIRLSADEVHFLGPDLELVNCRVLSKARGKNLIVDEAKLRGCLFETKVPLDGVAWCRATLEDSRFSGRFRSCDFGPWPEAYGVSSVLRHCDFSAAVLDGCRFFNCNKEDLLLPAWPCFTIWEPSRLAEAVSRLNWPARTRFWMEAATESPDETTAVVGWAPGILKKTGGDEEEFRNLLRRLGPSVTLDAVSDLGLTEDVLREATALIDALRSGVLSDDELSDTAVRLDALLPDPRWFDYTIDHVPELSAEEVVRKAFQYRPIQP